MKIFLRIFFVILLNVVCRASDCNDGNYKIALNIPKGYKASLTSCSKFSQNVELSNNQKFISYGDMKNCSTLECLNVDANGVMTIKKTFESIGHRLEISNGVSSSVHVDFDSTDPDKVNKDFYMEPIIGESVIVKIKPDGTVLKYKGLREIAEKIVRKRYINRNSSEDPKEKEIEIEMKKNKFLPGSLAVYPSDAVKVGQVWKMPFSNSCGENGACPVYDWKLEKVENEVAFIIVRAVDQKIPTIEVEDLKRDMKETVLIDLQVDLKTGLMKSCSGEIVRKGTDKTQEGSSNLNFKSEFERKIEEI